MAFYDVRNAECVIGAVYLQRVLRATTILSWCTLFGFESGCSLHSWGEGGKLASHTILSPWPRWACIPKAERRNATRRLSIQPRECVHNLDVALSAVNAFLQLLLIYAP